MRHKKKAKIVGANVHGERLSWLKGWLSFFLYPAIVFVTVCDFCFCFLFRPSFRCFTWHTCILGILGCVVMMFLINAIYAFASIAFMLLLLMLIQYLGPISNWGYISQALIFHQVRSHKEAFFVSWSSNVMHEFRDRHNCFHPFCACSPRCANTCWCWMCVRITWSSGGSRCCWWWRIHAAAPASWLSSMTWRRVASMSWVTWSWVYWVRIL